MVIISQNIINSSLANALQQSVIIYNDKFNSDSCISKENFLHKIEYNFFLNSNKNEVIYKTPLCLQLAQIYKANSLEIAKKICAIFNSLIDDNYFYSYINKSNLPKYWSNEQTFLKDSIAKVSGEVWLEFYLSKGTLSKYLDYLCFTPFPALKNTQKKAIIDFNFIYVHGRFCSILRSAHEQGMIKLDNLDFVLNQWNIIEPEEIDYSLLIYDKYQDLPLIRCLIYCSEIILNNQQKVNYFSLLKKLNKELTTWEKNCRIWGEIKQRHLSFSQARLGLSAIALSYYQNLCHLVFNQCLPTQL